MEEILRKQRDYYLSGATLPFEARRNTLKKLYDAIETHVDELQEALKEDLGKSATESYMCEIGLSLIMSPWNYPFLLLISPLVGALAADNCCVLKPSELAPATARAITRMIEDTFPAELVCIVNGGVEESQALLALDFDYIFYTGSVGVGKIVMEKAAKHLTPVTLELGGIGESGMGAYHGKDSFLTFTHRKTVVARATWLDPSLRYQPYKGWKDKFIRRYLK